MLLFHVIHQSFVVFAHEGLLVGAGDVVPGHAVAVEVVEDGEARLVVLALTYLKLVMKDGARPTMHDRKRHPEMCSSHATRQVAPTVHYVNPFRAVHCGWRRNANRSACLGVYSIAGSPRG